MLYKTVRQNCIVCKELEIKHDLKFHMQKTNANRSVRCFGSIDTGGSNIDYRTLVGCGRSKGGLGSAAGLAASRDLTILGRLGPLARRRGDRSCQYIDIDVTQGRTTLRGRFDSTKV